MGNITELQSNTTLIKELPLPAEGNDEPIQINLSYLDGWDDLNAEQKSYVSCYFDTYPQKFKALFMSGTSQRQFNNWCKEKLFSDMLESVRKIHAENLAAIDYKESLVNPKIRQRNLKAMKAEGHADKQQGKTTNNLNLITKDMSSALKALKGED
jgi:hypothetical protein